MDEYFTTKTVEQLYSISHQTVKNWVTEFAAYLSPTATPPAGRKRMFQPSDLTVFALVSDYIKRGFRYEDAHMALRAGQRGSIPASDSELTPTVPPALLAQLREEIRNRDAIIQQITAEREQMRGQNNLLKEQLEAAQRRIEELIRGEKG